MSNKSNQLKKRLLESLEKNLGHVTEACKAAGISRKTFYKYKKEDPEFKKKVKEIEEIQIDFVESKLIQNIKKGDKTSIIFYLKTKGKHRGYYERVVRDNNNNNNVNIELTSDSIKKINEALENEY